MPPLRRFSALILVSALIALALAPLGSTTSWASGTDIGAPPDPLSATATGQPPPITNGGGQPRIPIAQQKATPDWLKLLNSYRARAGAPNLVLSRPLSSAATNHARYMLTNRVVTHTENPNLPGYTVSGDRAGRHSLVGAGFSSPEAYIIAWLSSPFHLIPLLDPTLTATGWGYAKNASTSTAVLDVYSERQAAVPTTGWPRTNTKGTITWLQMADPSYPDPAYGCPAPVGAWYGSPIVVDRGPNRTVTSAGATLTENGVRVPICVRVASSYADPTARAFMQGKALVIPRRPLKANARFSGEVRTNLGTSAIRFSTGTATPLSSAFGDVTGDGVADILAVNRANQLLSYRAGARSSLVGRSTVGTGWGSMNWMQTVPDLNGDGHTDLLARSTSGRLFVYWGGGNGRWSGRSVLPGSWGHYTLLSMVGDITGDQRPDLLARDRAGTLWRISFTGSTSLGRPARVGSGWQGMRFVFSVGDRSGNRVPDILAVDRSGILMRYSLTRDGRFTGARAVVGRGWQSMSAVYSPGDLTGDGRWDLVARSSSGVLYCYPNLTTAWGSRRTIGSSGWNSMRLLS